MPDTPQHGGTNEDSCIGIVRRRSSWHGVHCAGASHGTDHGCASCNHRNRLALRAGLARQSLGPLRPEPAHLSPLPILGTAAFLQASPPPLAAPSLAASSPPRTPPSSPWASFVIGSPITRLVHRGGFLFEQSAARSTGSDLTGEYPAHGRDDRKGSCLSNTVGRKDLQEKQQLRHEAYRLFHIPFPLSA